MPSLIEGYEYDIFISYRQKDNKGERWVTEFVNSLRAELEANFKEDVSIYFDENAHDGLLETHQVEQSLETKLRSVLIIPVLSRTYCDPKSYAWTSEFLPFLSRIKSDDVGPLVKFPGGNVSSRILPVRIHDLDPADQTLFEKVSGSRIRAVDFVFKSPGVNRPMHAREDHPHDNLNKTYYRDQVNKVANAVRDLIQAIRAGKQEVHQASIKPGVTVDESGARTKPSSGKRSLAKWAAVSLASIVIVGGVAWFIDRQGKIRWAKDIAIPAIAVMIDDKPYSDLATPYDLAVEAERFVPGNPRLDSLFGRCAVHINIGTEPPGAKVYYKRYDKNEADWTYLGESPIDSVRMPIATLLWKFEKEGFEPVQAVATTWNIEMKSKSFFTPFHLMRRLDRSSVFPPGMVRVNDQRVEPVLDDFFIDKFEVTNKRYQRFVLAGGYLDRKYWKVDIEEDGKVLTWEQAMARFVDQTGRPGPANWEAGEYPEGKEEYPVSGISWYEAAAFAEFEGKNLPTSMHWNLARGGGTPLVHPNLEGVTPLLLASNYGGKAVAPVGSFGGTTAFGAMDMAGNCKEWCWNKANNARITRGGAWTDPIYSFGQTQSEAPMTRSDNIGFRCVLYPDIKRIPENVFEPFTPLKLPDFYSIKPVSAEIFDVYKEQFTYDKGDRDASSTPLPDAAAAWRAERIRLSAAYAGEKLDAFLFLPTNAPPPYQTVIYFPGSGAAYLSSSEGLGQSDEFNNMLSFLLKGGRAVLWPVYKGTFERGGGTLPPYHIGDTTRAFTEYLRQLVKDFRIRVSTIWKRGPILTARSLPTWDLVGGQD